MERTLIICKPDAVQRRLVGKVIQRFEEKGLKLVAARFLRITQAMAEELYKPHLGKKFYPSLLSFMTKAPVLALCVEGARAVEVCRKLMGATFGYDAAPGTIRGDFGVSNQFNLVHGSDSPESAERELGIFFKPNDMVEYGLADDAWNASE